MDPERYGTVRVWLAERDLALQRELRSLARRRGNPSRGQVSWTRPAPHSRLSPQPLPPSPQMCASGCCPRRRNLRCPSHRPRGVSSRFWRVVPKGSPPVFVDKPAMAGAAIPVATTCRPPLPILMWREDPQFASRFGGTNKYTNRIFLQVSVLTIAMATNQALQTCLQT